VSSCQILQSIVVGTGTSFASSSWWTLLGMPFFSMGVWRGKPCGASWTRSVSGPLEATPAMRSQRQAGLVTTPGMPAVSYAKPYPHTAPDSPTSKSSPSQ
jgi:hypothetical protein